MATATTPKKLTAATPEEMEELRADLRRGPAKVKLKRAEDLELAEMLQQALQERDAARAETAAVVRERDEARSHLNQALEHAAIGWDRAATAGAALDVAERDASQLSSLAADLVEGLAGLVARYGDFAPGKPFIFPPNHHIDLARALLTRAAALGVGKPQDGEKENG